jgi:hypothetical protein
MHGSTAVMAFTEWSEPEARERIATLRRLGWSVPQLAAMFGTPAKEIERLCEPVEECA